MESLALPATIVAVTYLASRIAETVTRFVNERYYRRRDEANALLPKFYCDDCGDRVKAGAV